MAATGEYKSLLTGNFDISSLPEVPSKLIRVYLATTPTDTVQERNALVEKVYPGLREYTRHNYGLEFQVVDLRWGLPEEEWMDHSPDRALCLSELTTCQQLSAGPSFVGLLGQRYGDRPLPASIPASDFELIRSTLRHHRNRETRDAWLLDQFYKKDCNTKPPAYLLQSIDSIRDNLKPKSAVDRLIIGEREPEWPEARVALKRLLQRGVEYCLLEGTMVESDAFTYLTSDLEKEFRQGILFSSDPHNSCHVFQRSIVDLKNYVAHPLAPKFMEIMYNEKEDKLQVDEEAEKRLSALQEEKIPKWLVASNVSSFSVLWKHDQGIHTELHKEYLEEFCQTFTKELQGLVDLVAHTQLSEPLPPVVEEVFQHWLHVKHRDPCFTARHHIMEIIKSYVMSNDSHPLVLHGEAGCGKTAIMAKTAAEVSQWMGGEVVTVVRFLGLTVASFDVRQLLYNICLQLTSVLGRDDTQVPNSYKELQSYFLDLLEGFPEDKNLVLLLDGLHMLVPQYNAHFLQWLPRQLRENVKVIVSTAPDLHGIMQRLRHEVVLDENNFVEVGVLTAAESVELVESLLDREGRELSSSQKQAVSQACIAGVLPLYLRILTTNARKWTSMVEVEASSLPTSIKEYINSFFDKLEKTYGQCLVSRSLAYLTASTTGLSDLEMEDILSLDDVVLNEVYETHTPCLRRLPPIAWLRLKHELQDFLVRRECEGITVYFWNHRLFIEAAKARYLSEESGRKDIHSFLADYMLGVWHGSEKPYQRPSSANNNEEKGSADRLVPSQPLTFQAADGTTRFNKRKYDQVPRHLYLSGRLEELNELVLFSYNWLYNKTKALSLEHVLADFVLNPGLEATLVERALRDAQPFIAVAVDNMAPELCGRLLAYYTSHPDIRKLIQECDTEGLKHCALIPNFPYHQVPGSPLKYSIQCKGTPTSFSLTGADARFMYAKELSSQVVQMYDLATGELKGEILTSIGEMYVTPDGSKVAVVDHVTQKAIKIHCSDSGQYLGQLIPQNQIQMKPKEKYKLGQVCISDTHLSMVVTTETSYLCVARLDTCKFVQVLGLESRATVCTMTQDSRFVYCNSDTTVYGYSVETLEKVNHTPLEHRPSQLIFNSSSTRGFLINNQENKIYVMTLRDGDLDFMYKVVLNDSFPGDHVCHLQLSNNQELLLARGDANLVVYNVSSEKVACHFPRPPEVPAEFKLPKSHYQGIKFTQANFSPDDKFVIATIFRNVYIWHVANNRMLTTLQAPVGIIKDLYIPSDRGQIVTHLEGSNILHVWSLGDAIGHVGTLDRLTTSIDDIQLTSNDRLAYVKCVGSDELGVLDMGSGQLVDLLTHESPVESFSISATGEYALVALKAAKPGTFNKLWHTSGRRIIYEFGSTGAYSVALRNEDSLVAVVQDQPAFKAPYTITHFKCSNGAFEEFTYDAPVNFVLDTPFVTPEDRYLVILSAESYEEKNAFYKDPTICAISLRCNSPMHMFSASDLKEVVRIRRILHIRPYANSSYTVIVLYTNEPDDPTYKTYDHCYGFMIFDVCSGVVCHVIEDLLAPSTPINDIFFTNDVQLCIDNQSNVFDMHTGYYMKQLYQEDCPPRALALNGKVVLYYSGQHLFAIRLSDARCIARVHVHGEITFVRVCHDERTLVAGCGDGSLVSYVLVDEVVEDAREVLAGITSRSAPLKAAPDSCLPRSWDRVDSDGPPYSRPPSSMTPGPQDKERLRQVKPATPSRPSSDTLLYQNPNSRSCVVM